MLTHSDNMVQKIDELKATIRFQMKKVKQLSAVWRLYAYKCMYVYILEVYTHVQVYMHM